MVQTPGAPRSHCPINFGLEIFGDRWTLLILRDMLMAGKRSFKAFQQSEEAIATNILAERLARLAKAGIITREPDPGDRRQWLYAPTDAGRALLPALVELAYWGATHDPCTDAPAEFVKAYEADRTGLLKAMAGGFDPRGTPET